MRSLGQPPQTLVVGDHEGKLIPGKEFVLGQRLEPEAGLQQGRDDLADAMGPFVAPGILQAHGFIAVAADFVEDERLGLVKIAIVDDEVPIRPGLVEAEAKGWASQK